MTDRQTTARHKYTVKAQPHYPGRWIIVYAQPVRGFENDSVDAISYPSIAAAYAAIEALA